MRLRALSILVLAFVLPLLAVSARADTPGILSAGPFAVLGLAGVTNTNPTTNLPFGPTTITGSVAGYMLPGPSGASPAVTGLVATQVIAPGVLYLAGAPNSPTVFGDATNAYNLAATALNPMLIGPELGGLTLTPGVYSVGAAQLTGLLTLNAQGNNNAQWTFQIASSLNTASGSGVQLINAGAPGTFGGGITWQVVSAATLGTTTAFLGTIISNAGIVLKTGATIECGRAISLDASVTLDTNTISNGCLVSAGTGGGGGTITAPEPGTFGLLSVGLLAMVFLTFCKSRVSSLLLSC